MVTSFMLSWQYSRPLIIFLICNHESVEMLCLTPRIASTKPWVNMHISHSRGYSIAMTLCMHWGASIQCVLHQRPMQACGRSEIEAKLDKWGVESK